MIPTNRQERYDAFASNLKSGYYYDADSVAMDALFHYLENEDVSIPVYSSGYDNWYVNEIAGLLERPAQWEDFDNRIINMMASFWASPLTVSSYYLNPQQFISTWSYRADVSAMDLQAFHSMGRLLEKHNVNEGFLGINLLSAHTNTEQVTPSGQYILNTIDKILSVSPEMENVYFFQLLLKYDEPMLDKYLNQLIHLNTDRIIGFDNIPYLLAHNAQKYEAFTAKIAKNADNKMEALQVAIMLGQSFSSKYDADIRNLCYAYLESIKSTFKDTYFRFDWYRNQKTNDYKYFINIVFETLFEKEPIETAFNALQNFLKECPHTSTRIIEFLQKQLGENSLPILIEALDKNDCDGSNTHEAVLNILKQNPHEVFYPQLWDLVRHNSKKVRSLIARHLAAVQGEDAIPNAEKLLSDKKGDVRLVGALILSLVKTEKALAILRGTLNNEKNDDARDAMLEGLAGLMNGERDQKAILEGVAQAKTRGKLAKPLAEWLNTEGGNYPKLNWTTGENMDTDTVDFLFYRMNRAKDIRIDMEAKPLFDFIDKSKSAPFAKVLLKKYFENGADAKFKWCMTLGSMLGGDDEMDVIKRKVNEWAEASRGKMAEYAVKALAMNGSTKALRVVEFFSRKYKSKNKNIGAAAIESFGLVAEELGITLYDLADSIIPDFGFEGLFRNFEVGGEPYRAYINNDFKIAFLDEDNRNLKALPKGTSAALKEEFKDTAKEIRDIVKSQSSRLEQYLVIQRKWSIEKWDAFFRGNPVMFAYAIRSIWGIFDEKQQIVTTFQCLEDQTLVNMEGDELDLDEYTEGYQIGMMHPMLMTEAEINHWKDALADADVQPIFSQLERPVIHLKEGDAAVKLCKEFEGIAFGGYAFVAKMEKMGWFRGSVVDGGGISSYYKDFSELGVTAIVGQSGNIGVGYYEENAELGELMFVKAKSVGFGSYSYDEPSKNEDERLIALGDVPPIVYSEVMADMLFFKENQIKKETN
jgi:hypothetical protein